MRDFITADAVAAMIGFTAATAFLRHRPRLLAEHGFPQPMPTSQRPLRWRRDEVEAWAARQGTAQATPVVLPQGGNVQLLRLARTA